MGYSIYKLTNLVYNLSQVSRKLAFVNESKFEDNCFTFSCKLLVYPSINRQTIGWQPINQHQTGDFMWKTIVSYFPEWQVFFQAFIVFLVPYVAALAFKRIRSEGDNSNGHK